jgi:hypothetical protein
MGAQYVSCEIRNLIFKYYLEEIRAPKCCKWEFWVSYGDDCEVLLFYGMWLRVAWYYMSEDSNLHVFVSAIISRDKVQC